MVEGSALRIANRVRVTAQLIDAATDRHLWANDYDRDMADVLSVHREVARAIAREVRAAVSPAEKNQFSAPQSRNPEAQEQFLLGRYQVSKLNAASLTAAISHFERAVQLDPAFAAAWAGLGRALYESGIWGTDKWQAVKERARAAATRAVTVDPNEASAHVTLG